MGRDSLKNCSVCKERKDHKDFYKFKHGKDGRSYRCKVCDDLARRKYITNNPERHKKSAKGHYLKHSYKISLDDYNAMLTEQNNSCAICGINNIEEVRSLCVDHNHITGKIRGLLCNRCNRGIGLLRDNPEVLRKAANYLETH